jgi:hypothetical protein
MLSQVEVESIFRDYIAEEVKIEFVDRVTFIRSALDNPFIKMQIQVGIYDEKNIYADFLGPACAYVGQRRLELCYDLMVDHAAGVADDLTTAYITAMAMHEAHHFETDHVPTDAEGHALSELECIAATKAKDPALEARAQEFERKSSVYKRVYERIAEIQKERIQG